MLKLDTQVPIEIGTKSLFTSAQIAPNGQYIAISHDISILLYQISTKTLTTILTTHIKPINDLCWSPDCECIATASDDFTIEITHIYYGRIHRLMNHTAPVISLVYNFKGNLLCSVSMDETIKEWDAISGVLLKTMSAHSDPVVSIDIPKCDATILSSGSYDGLIRIFDTKSGHCLKTLTYDKDWQADDGVVPISKVKFSSNGKFLMVKSLDGIVKIWDFIKGCVVRTFKLEGGSQQLKYSCGIDFMYPKHGTITPLIISGDENGKIYCWDVQSKQLTQTMVNSYHKSPVISISCHSDLSCSLSLNGECNLWRWI